MGVLRVLLALCVFFSHTRNATPFDRLLTGNYAVEAFFLISGFYMQIVLTRRYSRATLGPRWVRVFYIARFGRLYPAYALIAAAAAGLSAIGLMEQPHGVWAAVAALDLSPSNIGLRAFLAFTNVTIWFQDVTMFLGVNAGHAHFTADFRTSDLDLWRGLAVPQGWSLGIELSFYALAPFLLNLRSRWLVIVAAASLGAKLVVLQRWGLTDPFTYRFFPFELCYFLAGSLVYRARRWLDLGALPLAARLGLAALLVAFVVADPLPWGASPDDRVAVLALGLPLIFGTTARLGLDRAIGELSYPFYISHWLALSLVDGPRNTWTALTLALVIAVALLALEQLLVEPWRERLAGTEREIPARSGNIGRLLGLRRAA